MINLLKPSISDEVMEKIGETIASGMIGEGPRVVEFENALEEVLGEPVLTTNSCTSALSLAYHLINLKPGDEVISTPMTCTATNMPLLHRGVDIIWTDVEPDTGNISCQDVMQKITPRTKAIVAVDWAGRVCNYRELHAIASKIPIVEDAAHAFGSQGLGGDYIAWSFQAVKALTTIDGGALKVPVPYQTRARLLRWFGMDRTLAGEQRLLANITDPGFKYHMNDVTAAIGLAQLEPAIEQVHTQRNNAQLYCEELQGLRRVTAPPFDENSSYWLFTVLVEDRDSFRAFMRVRDIEVGVAHVRNDIYSCFPDPTTELPNLDYFSEHMINIPVGWWLTQREKERVMQAVRDWSND